MMNQVYNLISSIKSALNYLIDTYWTPIDVNLKSAIIGIFSALLVTFLTDLLERKRNIDQQKETEVNKLKYLHFLMEDTFILIDSYDVDTKKFVDSFNNNPFIIPSSELHSSHSLNAIANKINQEDYYLSSVNRLENTDVAHIFLMYNSIENTFSKATAHYRNEFTSLIIDKEKYEVDLNELMEATRQFYIKLRDKKRSSEEEAVWRKLSSSIILVPPTVNSLLERDKWLRESRIIFIEKLIGILPLNVNQDLDSKIKRATTSHSFYVSRMFNVVESMKRNREDMNRVIANIKVLASPLHEYITKKGN